VLGGDSDGGRPVIVSLGELFDAPVALEAFVFFPVGNGVLPLRFSGGSSGGLLGGSFGAIFFVGGV